MVDWVDEDGNDLTTVEHRDELVLSDGGVYDNLGLETAWKRCRTLIVSDGELMAPEARSQGDWLRHGAGAAGSRPSVAHPAQAPGHRGHEARRPRRRLCGHPQQHRRLRAARRAAALFERTLALAEIPTRLDGLPDELQERLINWGYAVGDAGLRKHLDEAARRRPGFPYPDAGV